MNLNLNCRASLLLLAVFFRLLPLSASADLATNLPSASTNAVFHAAPGPDDGRIAFFTALLLQNYHYSRLPFDDTLSSRFLDRYVQSLDPQHIHFLQSDIDEFEKYRTILDNLTLNRRERADTAPAYDILTRFVDRLRQKIDYSDQLLKTNNFHFDTDERITIDRRESPYPRDINEAHDLWRQRLRFEYLQEKLGYAAKKPKPGAPAVSKEEAARTMHEEIAEKLAHRYYRTLRLFTDWNNEDVLGLYLTALAHVYDPHSDYFNKAELEGFKISMNLQLFGIGAELRSTEDGYCKIERLLPGGPAIKAKKGNKLSPGDHIVAVAQGDQTPVDVVDMPLTKIVQKIRGPKGTEVRLTVQPGGDKSSEQKVVTLIRDEIRLEDQAAKGTIIELPQPDGRITRLGVINLPSFYAPMDPGAPVAASDGAGSAARYTSADIAKLIAKFKEEKVSGVILDLRLNGGGVLEEAIKVAGLFIKKGPIVQARFPSQTRPSEMTVEVYNDEDPTVAYDGPLIVLTSRFSASASEIVAGALQDYGRALIVGDSSTHGKGTVQTVTSLRPLMKLSETDPEEPGALKFTIRKFYRASGASTQLKGVLPDIVLPSRWNFSKDVGEAALDNPLPWDTIDSARYDKLNLVQPYLSELLKRSTERIATNQDFKYVREDIEEFRKQQADKTLSLNEKQRLKEKEELDARQKARDNELRARKEPDQKIYEISLKQAELPGLPPPVEKTNSVALKGGTDSGSTESTSAFAGGLGDDTEGEEKPPAVDPNLEESEHILMDYIALLPKESAIAVTH